MFCGICGKKNPEGSVRCCECGNLIGDGEEDKGPS